MIPTLEMSLITKLRALGTGLEMDGLRTLDQRRELVRAALLPLDDVTYTVANGKRVTLGTQFAAVYGEPP